MLHKSHAMQIYIKHPKGYMEVCVSRETVKRIINIGDMDHLRKERTRQRKQAGVRKHTGLAQKPKGRRKPLGSSIKFIRTKTYANHRTQGKETHKVW